MLVAFLAVSLLELTGKLGLMAGMPQRMSESDRIAAFVVLGSGVAFVAGPVCLLVIDQLWKLRVRRGGLKAFGKIVKVERSGLAVNKIERFWLTLEVDLSADAIAPPSRASGYRATPPRRAKEPIFTRAIVTVPQGFGALMKCGEWATMLLDPGDRKRALVERTDLRAEPPD